MAMKLDLGGDGTAAPPGGEAVRLPFDFDVGAAAVDGVRRREVVKRHQKMQVLLRLFHPPMDQLMDSEIKGGKSYLDV